MERLVIDEEQGEGWGSVRGPLWGEPEATGKHRRVRENCAHPGPLGRGTGPAASGPPTPLDPHEPRGGCHSEQ